ncbi:ABC transporter permease [Foetidibacter luteolus]|uniref:ABC transporter permease n=1 Tax=Foetidibacter luteolus TaxID=2608880 RepID=UPI00129A6EE9|nr:ABC transporter permease [Foetidibacter luteolus]
MIKSYLKIAWRNLFRNKGFALTNLLGLTIGITCTIFILLWVRDELTYDKFHANYNNIHVVIANRDFKNRVFTDYNMVLPLAQAIEGKSPQVKHAVVTTQNYEQIVGYGDAKLKKSGYTVSEHFFNMFTWKFIKGNPATALKDPSSVVLTQSAAKAFFGDKDPINKVLRIDNSEDVKVTAVVADPPGNSSFTFDYIRPFNYNDPDTKRSMENWVNSSWRLYVQTAEGANMKQVDKLVNDIKKSHDNNDKISTYFTFPMSRWRLYSEFKDGINTGGMIEYVRLFTIIAIIILLIACINFMNLSTARSERRSKEVGIRKTLGSGKKQLVLQFFFESMILVLIAFVFSVASVYLLLPSFNLLVSKHLVLGITQPVFWLAAAAIILFTGVIAGSYPALYLSSFNPVTVLKGTFLAGKKAALPRRVLVVGQFVISILLISATIIVYMQIQHIKNRDIGYNAQNLLMVPMTSDLEKNYAVVKQELLNSGSISAVTRTSSPITQVWWKSGAPDWNGKPADLSLIISGLRTDVGLTQTMGIKMLEGHDFSGMPADSANVLLNKAAVEAMQLKKPIGMEMRFGDEKYTVIGVTDNIVMESPFQPVDPMLVFYNPNYNNIVSLRLSEKAQLQKVLPLLETVFKKYNPAYPFEYQFADEEFGKKFIAEELIRKLTNIFAGLAIFICCIGLAGLASFTIEKRIREIGIRKVLGASVQQVLLLISREFLRLVLIAFIIAVPIAWWAMHSWLQKYTYHISISIWLFIAVGGMVLLLTLLVVSLNTMRAALANPVKSLRTE